MGKIEGLENLAKVAVWAAWLAGGHHGDLGVFYVIAPHIVYICVLFSEYYIATYVLWFFAKHVKQELPSFRGVVVHLFICNGAIIIGLGMLFFISYLTSTKPVHPGLRVPDGEATITELQRNRNLEDYQKDGLSAYSKGDYKRSILLYDTGLLVFPSEESLYYGRGVAKCQLNDTDGALADFNQSVKLNPTDSDAYYGRALVKANKQDVEGVLADASEVIKLKPDYARAYMIRGVAKFEKKDFLGGMADANKAIDLAPTDAGLFAFRADMEKEQGNIDGAIADLNKAIELNPTSSDAYRERGSVKMAMRDFDGTLADASSALEINPDDADACRLKGYAKYEKGDMDGAIASFDQAITLNSKDPVAYEGRGLAKWNNEDLSGAQDDLQQFCSLSPRSPNADYAHILMWLIQSELGKNSEADSELSVSLNKGWNGAPDGWTTKIAQFLLGRISEADYLAAASSPDAGKDQGQHCDAWYYAGMKRLLTNDPSAKSYFQKCVATGETDHGEFKFAESELAKLDAVTQRDSPQPPPITPPATTVGTGSAPSQ